MVDTLSQNADRIADQMAQGLARDPRSNVNQLNVAATSDALKPMVLHVTNNEPWYQSRVTLGAILSLVAAVSAIFGYAIEPELMSRLLDGFVSIGIAIGLIAGPLTTLYGRWVARKPLGS